MTGSGIEVLVEVGRARMCARCARETKCCVMGARASLPAAGGHAGGRRGCHSHGNLQFSCSFFLQVRGFRMDACASGLGAWIYWMQPGRHWIVLCAGIAAADGNCVVAWRGFPQFRRSRRVGDRRYRGCCGCGTRRGGGRRCAVRARCTGCSSWEAEALERY